eukprot:gene11994-biopygen6948
MWRAVWNAVRRRVAVLQCGARRAAPSAVCAVWRRADAVRTMRRAGTAVRHRVAPCGKDAPCGVPCGMPC